MSDETSEAQRLWSEVAEVRWLYGEAMVTLESVRVLAEDWREGLTRGCPTCGPDRDFCDHQEGYNHALADLRKVIEPKPSERVVTTESVECDHCGIHGQLADVIGVAHGECVGKFVDHEFVADRIADAVLSSGLVVPVGGRIEYDPADDMCPNCITPWKCNGPHALDTTPRA